ncbi:hypothetical protein AVEN_151782-1, partial [Araneus ventricosus]
MLKVHHLQQPYAEKETLLLQHMYQAVFGGKQPA